MTIQMHADRPEHELDPRAESAARAENGDSDLAQLAIAYRCVDAYAEAPASVIRSAWGVAPWPQ